MSLEDFQEIDRNKRQNCLVQNNKSTIWNVLLNRLQLNAHSLECLPKTQTLDPFHYVNLGFISNRAGLNRVFPVELSFLSLMFWEQFTLPK